LTKKTNKTAHVLRLLTNSEETTKENPILNAEFKDEMIHSRNNIDKKPAPEQPKKAENTTPPKAIGVNIISELVQENLPSILERFRCCSCDLCKAEITISALNQIPPQYAYIKNGSDAEVNKLKEKNKAKVVSALVKLTFHLKNNPIHK